MRVGALSVVALGLLAACGSNTEERAASGGGTGAVIGALAGGPVGLAIGAAAGGTGGAVEPRGIDKEAEVALGKIKGDKTAGSGATAMSDRDTTRQAQQALQAKGYYKGKIDGIAGAQTRRALAAYQQSEGLRQTGALDRTTLEHLDVAADSGTRGTMSGSGTSGTTTDATTGASGQSNDAGAPSGGDTTRTATPPRQ